MTTFPNTTNSSNLLAFMTTLYSDKELQVRQQEEQIVGHLFRELLNFEWQIYDETNIRKMNLLVQQAQRQCHSLGCGQKLLEALLQRLDIRVG